MQRVILVMPNNQRSKQEARQTNTATAITNAENAIT